MKETDISHSALGIVELIFYPAHGDRTIEICRCPKRGSVVGIGDLFYVRCRARIFFARNAQFPAAWLCRRRCPGSN